jgi:hypothetical protein
MSKLLLYLDIDGTLLNKNGTPANGASELIKYCVENFDTHWLTTHCKGDSEITFRHIKRFFPEETHTYLKQIKATNWGALKTDALDFSKDFIWLDDYLLQTEYLILEKNKVEHKHLMIYLEENPYQLEEILTFLQEDEKRN